MFGLFQPPELKATLAALDDLRPSFKQDSQAVEIAFGGARRMILMEKANTVACVRDRKWKPRDLALLVVSKLAFRRAASGEYHVYRNAPSPVGVGLRSIFDQVGEEMVASGFIEQAEHEEDKRTLRKAMSEVG